MLDDRDSQTPGWKFNEWELRGVPLRMEIGPKDIEKSQVVLARRDTREKSFVPMDGLAAHVEELLATIQQALFDRAVAFRDEHTTRDRLLRRVQGRSWTAVPASSISPWCGSAACEADIKTETQATIRNIPFDSAPADGQDVPEVRRRRRPCTPGSRSRTETRLADPHIPAVIDIDRVATQ